MAINHFSYRHNNVLYISDFAPLKDLSIGLGTGSIHYFVGRNGSGKSRIFESILTGKAKRYQTVSTARRGTKATKNLRVATKVSALKWGRFEYNDKTERSSDFARTAATFEKMDQIPLSRNSQKVDISNERNEDGDVEAITKTVISHLHHGTRYLGPIMMSAGTKELYELENWEIPENIDKGNQISVILEEPENHLHPDIEKMLPSFLEEWLNRMRGKGYPRIQIFVSTHSPFLIKGIETAPITSKHNVYVLPENQEFENLKSIEPKPIGEAILHANHMLGSGLSDLLPKKILATEHSVAVLIQTVFKQLNINIPHFVADRGGATDHIRRINNIRDLAQMLRNLSTIYPEKYTLNLEYLIICDGVDEKAKILEELGKGNDDHIKVDVLTLGKKCLEEIYSRPAFATYITKYHKGKRPWDYKEDIKDYAKEILDIEGYKELGIFKRKLAEHVGAEIATVSDLKRELQPLHTILEKLATLQ